MARNPASVRPYAEPSSAPHDPANVRGLIVFAVAATVGVACMLWGLFLARQAVLLIYVSALFATGLAPMVRLLERRGIVPGRAPLPRWGAVTIVYLLSGAVGLVILLMIVPTLIGQMQDLARQAPDLLHRAQQW